jgi:molybdopterin-biosynthesis enzyme MoeA-like protein
MSRVGAAQTDSHMQTTDTNSSHMARFCFSLGMSLKRIEVIGDDEDEIIEAARRMSRNYDFVVTSGGIGPTFVTIQGHKFKEGC